MYLCLKETYLLPGIRARDWLQPVPPAANRKHPYLTYYFSRSFKTHSIPTKLKVNKV